ncbi:late competence development ComFB family protein [Gallaecimonas kandeliae]|uniref:late competence development ComFB family protein n=1 Tax=Gallaecimonas kandeliae TaxID=3029055 RepID=UPI0026473F86|nr:late competence development ComFB family protein [Gallaecimonas kandeliae]WKE64720.1 late competence development ComFB family protein [Gallaecimonas kandeliae]
MHLSDDIHNLVEGMLLDELNTHPPELPSQEWADLCCLVLNKVPPRYVRHDVDAVYYMSDDEWDHIQRKLRAAIKESIEFLRGQDARHPEE